MTEDPVERAPGAVIVDEIVGELGELIEDHVLPITRQLGAFVVDLLDVALGPGRADDVGRLGNPLPQPVEALAAHAGGKHGNTAAAEDAGNRDTPATVISGRRPNRTVVRRIELPRHQTRHQAGVGREHFVGADHRKSAAEKDDDRCPHAGQFRRQHHVGGNGDPPFAARIIEPMHTPQVRSVGRVRVDPGDLRRNLLGDVGGISELAPGRQGDLRLAQSRDCRAPAPGVNDLGLNEEAHRAGLVSKVRPRARKASQSGKEADIIKSYYHWNNGIFGCRARSHPSWPSRPLPERLHPQRRTTRGSAHPRRPSRAYRAGAATGQPSG